MRLMLATFGLMVLLLVTPAQAQTQVREVKTPGGLMVWLIEDHTLPLISVRMAFTRSGSAYDAPDMQGQARMAAALLTEGAGKLDAAAFHDALEKNAIQLGFSTGDDVLYGDMKTLREHRDEAFRLMGLTLSSPRFDQDALDRTRNQTLTALRRDQTEPDYLAARAWNEAAFGDHPYGREARGTETTLAGLTGESLAAFAAHHLTRENLVLSVVGDITAEEVADLLDRHLDNLSATATLPEPVADIAVTATGMLHHPLDVPQSVAIFGMQGIARHDPDYYAAHLLNYILGGGGFASRLTEEVRVKRGLTYGIYTGLDPMMHAATLSGSVATRSDAMDETVQVIREVFGEVYSKGITEEELKAAIDYTTGSFALNLDTNHKLAGYLLSMQLYGLGIDYLEKRNSYFEAVTLDDVTRVAKRLLDPSTLLISVAGPESSETKHDE